MEFLQTFIALLLLLGFLSIMGAVLSSIMFGISSMFNNLPQNGRRHSEAMQDKALLDELDRHRKILELNRLDNLTRQAEERLKK